MSSNTRIKELRQRLGMSQEEFGRKIDCSRDVINNYERLRANVPAPTEIAIASAFNVRIEWLRTGELPMFLQTKEQYIDTLAEQYGLDGFAKKAITVYSELSADEKKVIRSFIEKLNGPEPDKKRLLLAGQGGSAEVEVKDPEGASNALKELKESKRKK